MAESKPVKTDKIGPVQYLAQVRQEGRKVVWPTRPETVTTTIMVMVMVVLMGVFFLITDTILKFVLDLFFRIFGGAA